MLRKRKFTFLLGVFFITLVLIGGCKKNEVNIVSSDEVNQADVVVKTNKGTEKKATVNDSKEIQRLLGNIESIFNNSDNISLFSDTEISEQEKQYSYQVKFYKEDSLIQEMNIQENKVTLDKENYTIDSDKGKELDNLKKHLLTISQ